MNEEDKDNINKEGDGSVDENQSQDENTPVAPQSSDEVGKENENTEKVQSESESSSDIAEETASPDQTEQEAPKTEENKKEHEVIHKKDGRLHIYVRQDKYKGELKSKNWVGRLYIDGKQKISSSGTQNLDEAIPILEKWFESLFTWLERCESEFGFDDLKGYDTQRLYAYLAERYLSFWFKKYSNYLEWPYIFIDE